MAVSESMTKGTDLERALSSIPSGLRKPLLLEFQSCLLAAQSADWERVGLKTGKLCEIVYSIVSGYAAGVYPSKPTKPPNMKGACEKLELLDSKTFSRSIRIQLPRVLIALYELRNNRDIGHIGGDVNPNEMDGRFFLRSSKWMVAEIVRMFHNVSEHEAGTLVESVSERSIDLTWFHGEAGRVLQKGLPAKEQVLFLLYAKTELSATKLVKFVDYKNPTLFKQRILKALDKERLIYFDEKESIARILPPGVDFVEKKLAEGRRS